MMMRCFLPLSSSSSPKRAQPCLWSGPCLFHALFKLFSRFLPRKTAQSQTGYVAVVGMTGNVSFYLAWEKINLIYVQMLAKVPGASWCANWFTKLVFTAGLHSMEELLTWCQREKKEGCCILGREDLSYLNESQWVQWEHLRECSFPEVPGRVPSLLPALGLWAEHHQLQMNSKWGTIPCGCSSWCMQPVQFAVSISTRGTVWGSFYIIGSKKTVNSAASLLVTWSEELFFPF